MAILHGVKKKVVKEVIRYYVETTGKDYDSFILDVTSNRNKQDSELTYNEWLAKHSFYLLSQHGVELADCIENKDVIRAAIKEEESRQNGEFYTPEVWAYDGREYLKDMLGDLWGEAYIWDASCGTGNLLKSIEYPQDKIFMSSLLSEDIEMVKTILPEVEAFQLDFLNGIDWDRNNLSFSEKLPPRLREVLENDLPIVFYMNPPYKVGMSDNTDVGAYMGSIGMAKCALDIFHQFMYRMIMLKRTYNLSKMYMGIFGPITLYHSKMLEPLFEELKTEFVFHDGMCFAAGDFSNTSESVGWVVGYLAWKPKLTMDDHKPVVLTVKASDVDNNITILGQRPIRNVDEGLDTWAKPHDVVRYFPLPSCTTFENFNGLGKGVQDALGYMMSGGKVTQATRRACITTLPNPDNVPVTVESFWRAVASFVARRCYAGNQNPYNNSQYYNKPDTTIEGYEAWIYDAVVVFLFDNSAHHTSYRNLPFDDEILNVPNPLFPISVDVVKSVVTDETVINDLNNSAPANDFILGIIDGIKDKWSVEAREMFEVGAGMLLDSLQGTIRQDKGYDKWSMSWDAGLWQLRNIEGLFSEDIESQYTYNLLRLKNKLLDGVYKYGFMMDSTVMGDLVTEDMEAE